MPKKRRIDLKSRMRAKIGPPAQWDNPPIVHAKDLAGWLGVSERKLYWLADLDDRRRSPHYVCRWIRKRNGFRLIESPKPMLKKLQRQILHELLSFVPVSESAHGFVPNRSVKTFVADHIQQPVCLKMDLKSFFPGIRAGKVYGFFDHLGYPKDVARLLTGLCTTATRPATFDPLNGIPVRGQSIRSTYVPRHLPQGAPSSPMLSNFCTYRLDRRLLGLASALNGRFTRYADDLLFSFSDPIERQTKNRMRRFAQCVAVIAIEEGFEVNFRKTRLMFRSQRQMSAGIVLNSHSNLPRAKFDRLKAILFNCVRFGAESQNRHQLPDFRQHLAGQIAWHKEINPVKAEKLEKLFAQIQW